ncbi:hypothetical protein CBF34_06825 [Vagococcus penaei]|uniref:Uncharacterized protein n=1 Tax=Vagococcus penaei TaxID=633807 RepID=A0A1Q2D3H0_9ENTE|nr:hypothetical protein [Vagococcus penaei]AQP52878.1 hypothetical protein BW732_00660 [Vagococcus penaei]RSU01367.1 hypothetical protein CBF34_06825 [Vagococcus penaei]
MKLKYFIQLFLCFTIAIIIPFSIIHLFNITDIALQLVLYLTLGYLLLVLPLTIIKLNQNKEI